MLAFALGMFLPSSVMPTTASAKALALYEEGKPVPDGAKLDVEVAGIVCYHEEPEAWNLPARMTANGPTAVVVSIEAPGENECSSVGFYPHGFFAELKEIQLKVTHKAETVIGRVFWKPEDPEPTQCVYEFQNPSGHFRVPGQAVVNNKLIGREIREHTCGRRKLRLFGQMTVTLRGSSGQVLEIRGT